MGKKLRISILPREMCFILRPLLKGPQTEQDNWETQSQSPHHFLWRFAVDGRETSSIKSFRWSDSTFLQDSFLNVSLRFYILC